MQQIVFHLFVHIKHHFYVIVYTVPQKRSPNVQISYGV